MRVPGGRRWTAALVTGQLAMTMMLLTGAGLMVRGVMVYFQTDTGILIVVSLVACLIRARRATRLDPVAALRSE